MRLMKNNPSIQLVENYFPSKKYKNIIGQNSKIIVIIQNYIKIISMKNIKCKRPKTTLLHEILLREKFSKNLLHTQFHKLHTLSL